MNNGRLYKNMQKEPSYKDLIKKIDETYSEGLLPDFLKKLCKASMKLEKRIKIWKTVV